eukprot:6213938-Pleurochrysis_carterae.AAC.1
MYKKGKRSRHQAPKKSSLLPNVSHQLGGASGVPAAPQRDRRGSERNGSERTPMPASAEHNHN